MINECRPFDAHWRPLMYTLTDSTSCLNAHLNRQYCCSRIAATGIRCEKVELSGRGIAGYCQILRLKRIRLPPHDRRKSLAMKENARHISKGYIQERFRHHSACKRFGHWVGLGQPRASTIAWNSAICTSLAPVITRTLQLRKKKAIKRKQSIVALGANKTK